MESQMAKNNFVKNNFSEKYRVEDGSKFQLKDWETSSGEKIDEDEAEDQLEEIVEQISDLQNILYADNKWSLLLIFKRWMQQGKTLQSKTYCRVSIRRGVKCMLLAARP